MAEVLDDLNAIAAVDPAAREQLQEDLRNVDVESWPMVVKQFRSALAYREQLEARETAPPSGTSPQEPTLSSMDALTEALRNLSTGKARPVSFAPEDQKSVSAAGPSDYRQPSEVVRPESAVADGVRSQQEVSPEEMALSVAPPPVAQLRPGSSSTFPVEPAAGYAAIARSAMRQDEAVRQVSFEPSGPVTRTGQEHLEKAIEVLQQEAPTSPGSIDDLHQHMRLRMLRLLTGNNELALKPIPGASAAQQDYWNKQLFSLATFMDSSRHPNGKQRAAASLVQLDHAREKLAELATLQVRNLNFVSKIEGYGAYDPLAEVLFKPGEQVQLYAEVENFRSESTPDGYKTSLGTSYEVVDSNGQRVDGRQFPDVEDLCKRVRRDFHMQYGVDLPTRIYPGKYELRLIITDHQSQKIGQASVPFEIAQ